MAGKAPYTPKHLAAPVDDKRGSGAPASPRPVSPCSSRPRSRFVSFITAPARHHVLSAFLWLIALAILALMLLRFAPGFANNGRKIPSVTAFIPWLAIPAMVLLAPAVVWRRRFLVGLLTVMLGLQVFWHAGYLSPMSRLAAANAVSGYAQANATDDAYARVMTLNTKNGQADVSEIVQTVRDQHVEVLTLQEVTGDFLTRLDAAGIRECLPHRVDAKAQATDNGGINVVFTRATVEAADLNLAQTSSSAIPVVTIQVGGRSLRFGSVHLASPLRSGLGLWNYGLTALRSLSSDSDNLVLMGDFNSTWDHSRFRKMLGGTFADASEQAGEGFHMSYPANSKVPPVIEIDHIVYAVNAGVTVGDLQTLEIAGTDHMALLGTLRVE